MPIFFFRRKKLNPEPAKPAAPPAAATRRLDASFIQAVQQHAATTRAINAAAKQTSNDPPATAATAATAPALQSATHVFNPPVGWLAVIAGPGRGNIMQLHSGVNSIGRSSQAHVQINFGDESIAEHNHAVVSYNPKQRDFHLLRGRAEVALEVNAVNVNQPLELTGGECLNLGRTRLRFIPLCGRDFDWQDPINR